MKKYEILDHPAELRLKIYGRTIEELFKNAAEAMAQILSAEAAKFEIKNQKSPKQNKFAAGQVKIKIKVESIDINSLLVDFLNEILARSQINKAVYLVSDIKISRQSPAVGRWSKAELHGFSAARFNRDIKAITHYGVDIKKSPAGLWQTEIVFDI